MKRTLLVFFGLLSFAFAQYSPPGSPSLDYAWGGNGEMSEYLFLGLFRFIQPSPRKATNMILDERGDIVWYDQHIDWMLDFKVHWNGMMSYNQHNHFKLMDSTFNIVDTVRCQGYNTDVHDLIIAPDGHYFLICYEDSVMDLSGLYTRNGVPGDSQAVVSATLLQELDPNLNVVREWHAFEHFDIYDIDTVFFTNPGNVELNHTNSIDLDPQGNLLLSNRANHEVTYIDWDTGDIVWRLGGDNNEFTFPNDVGISAQHDARMLPDGRISIFDNGTYHSPNRARGLIYSLDTVNMTATLDWEYADLSLNSTSLGSFRVLDNGDAVVNFGAFNPYTFRNVAYVRQDCSLVLDIDIHDTYWTYRAQPGTLPFSPDRPEITCDDSGGQLTLTVMGSYPSQQWNTGDTGTSIVVPDTGDYQVFVPYGIGWMGSAVYHVSDLNGPCNAVSSPEPSPAPPKPRKLTGWFDILGRPVAQPQPGQLVIERYDDGSTRKIMMR